jgi:hypothetical protein
MNLAAVRDARPYASACVPENVRAGADPSGFGASTKLLRLRNGATRRPGARCDRQAQPGEARLTVALLVSLGADQKARAPEGTPAGCLGPSADQPQG